MRIVPKASATIALAVLGAVATDGAMAHGPRVRAHVGVVIGGPLYSPFYYPRPYYYYPPYYAPYYAPAVVVPSAPTVYVERGDGQTQTPSATPAPAPSAPPQTPAPQSAAPQQYWYYCAEAKAYYPYVRECAEGWMTVVPRPEQAARQ